MHTEVSKMCNTLIHRGPDAEGIWINEEIGIAFSHRRLAILDLSPNGAQPMLSSSGRYKIIFNGEIYNHEVIKGEILALQNGNVSWKGHSDTATMLAAFEVWGIHKAVEKFNGMFAFAVWDFKEKKLYLGRDRVGEKPLYYGWCNSFFLFGSELKALKTHSSFKREINLEAIALFLKLGYIPQPHSIYKGIYKLPPGTLLCLDSTHLQNRTIPEPIEYWSLHQAVSRGKEDSLVGIPVDQVVNELDDLLSKAIAQQMVADVPVGAFLSGGIDSSTIVALMQKQSTNQVKTFTVGFEQSSINEAEIAKLVSNHLNTDHTSIYVTHKEAMEVIPLVPSLYDEPFADSSQIPTFLISKLARQHVKVSLSGDAGDELFGGYNRHLFSQKMEFFMKNAPSQLRAYLGKFIRIFPASWLNNMAESYSQTLKNKKVISSFGDKMQKLSHVISTPSQNIYDTMVSNVYDINPLLASDAYQELTLGNTPLPVELRSLSEEIMYRDTLSYLPDDILVKVDRAAMGVGLETRIPMLDKDVIEYAWRLPLSMKIKDNKGKWILRQVLAKYVPTELMNRPKQGFAIPLDSWLRGPLYEWARSILSEENVNRAGILNYSVIETMLEQHRSGKKNLQNQLWCIIVLQLWLNE